MPSLRGSESSPDGEETLRGHLTQHREDGAIDALREPCNLTNEFAHLSTLTSRVIDRVLSETGSAGASSSLPAPASIREYQILGELGKGGMGSVYLAKHTRLHRNVALKLLPDHLAADPQFRGRFEREMAVIGQLDHPNLVSARDAGIEANRLFLVMELLEGANLADLVENDRTVGDGGRLPGNSPGGTQSALRSSTWHGSPRRQTGQPLFDQVGGRESHRSGVRQKHNLRKRRTTICPSMQTTLGTPHYMAPEQWEHSLGVDLAADIYALGCTLYFLLTGEPPFASRGVKGWVALFEAHRNESPAPVRSKRSDVSPGLDRLIARMLAKTPKDRPRAALVLSEDLTAFAAGQRLNSTGDRNAAPLFPPVPRAQIFRK